MAIISIQRAAIIWSLSPIRSITSSPFLYNQADGLLTLSLFVSLSLQCLIVRHALIRLSTVKYLPEWFPGAGFQKTARNWIKLVQESNNKPFEFVKYQMVGSQKSYEDKL